MMEACLLSLKQLNSVLAIWLRLSTDVRLRDRSVKAFQYGCQMLIGFYSKQFSKEFLTALNFTRRTGSNARKAFWILKSFNHLATTVKLIEQHVKNSDQLTLYFLVNLLEQLSLIIYFGYENLVLLSRTQLLGSALWKEDQLDAVGNIAWLVSDLAGFVSTLFHVVSLHERHRSAPGQCGESVASALISLLISFLELVVSADYMGLWRWLIQRDLGDGYVGLAGTTSSLLTLAQAAVTAVYY